MIFHFVAKETKAGGKLGNLPLELMTVEFRDLLIAPCFLHLAL